MRAYSHDLRSHWVQAMQAGASKGEAARIFGVRVRTINRYLQQLAASDSLRTKPIPGRPGRIPAEQEAELTAQLCAAPDATLEQQCSAWEACHGVRVSVATMSRALARLGWTWSTRH